MGRKKFFQYLPSLLIREEFRFCAKSVCTYLRRYVGGNFGGLEYSIYILELPPAKSLTLLKI